MAIYIPLNESDISRLGNEYGLEIIRHAPLDGGASNTSYLIEAISGQYVLTVFDESNHNAAFRLAELLPFLASQQYPTTRLVTSKNAGPMTFFEGNPVLLKRYIHGTVPDALDPDLLEQVGASMARLNEIDVRHLPLSSVPYALQPFPLIIGQGVEPEFEHWIAQKITVVESNLSRNLPCGLIHCDVFTDNLLVDNHSLAALIDFEAAVIHFKVFDLAMAILGTCGSLPENFDRVRALLAGYTKVRPLIVDEKTSLKPLIEYAAAMVACWRFWKFNIDTSNAERANYYRRAMDYAIRVGDISTKDFMNAVFGR